MKPALVTGASGFLGWHVARVLLERGYRGPGAWCGPAAACANSMSKRSPAICAIRASLERAVAGCGLVFHVAADYRLWAKDPQDLYRSNVDGTRNLLEAARSAGVERVVYTSTVGCIGIPHGGIGDEDDPVSLDDMAGDYKRSKFLAEQVALEFARGGLAGGDCESHRARWRPRREAHAHRQDRAGFPERRHAGVHRYRLERGGCARCGRGPLAGLRARPRGRALYSGLREPDPGADSAEAGRDHRPQGAHGAAAVCGGVLRRACAARLGRK